jgi:hypothetical protein
VTVTTRVAGEEGVVKYALLIYTPEVARDQAPAGAVEEMYESYAKFAAEFAPKLQGGEELQPTSTATTVRVENDEVVTTDGPFAETKEQIGGFYVLDCNDLDEALEYARKIPFRNGSVEVRPVMDYEAVGYEGPEQRQEAARS